MQFQVCNRPTTGEHIVRTPPAQMLRFFAHDHGNVILRGVFDKKIRHLAKLPGCDLRFLVISEEVYQKLVNEKV